MSTEFVNPHAGDPELGPAYEAGYRDGAFGDHVEDDPIPFPEGPQADAWREGFADGLTRFEAYKRGYAKGINAGLLRGVTSLTTPAPFPAGDLANAWRDGVADGLVTAQDVRDRIMAKAVETPHFDEPMIAIHSTSLGAAGRLYQQDFAGGRGIFLELPADVAFAVDAPIYAEYDRISGPTGLLGRPISDTRRVPDGRGLVCEFAKGSIYSTPETGPREVHGLIREHWLSKGGPSSYLGYPTSHEQAELADRGRVNTFERGDIYFWADTGVVDLAGVEVRYRGQNCFGESDELSGHDETYVVTSTIGPNQDATTSQVTPVTENIDAGGSFPDFRVVYSGPPARIGALAVTMMEHDTGNPNEYRGAIEGGVRTAMTALAGAIAATGVGLPVSAIAVTLANLGAGPIASAINDAIDTGDDLIGTDVFPLSPKEVIRLAKEPLSHERDIDFNLETALLTGEGSYKAYFDVDFLPHP